MSKIEFNMNKRSLKQLLGVGSMDDYVKGEETSND
jgi:hypothetical protein